MTVEDSLQAVKTNMARGNLSVAARECLAVLRRDPRNVNAMGLYGDLAMGMGRPDDAVVIFQKLLAVAPRHPGALDRLAYLFHQQGDYANASGHARRALQLDANLFQPHLVLGSVLLAQGREPEALAEFEKAKKLAPDNPNVESACAEALLSSGEFEAAADRLRQWIAGHPLDTGFYANLARTRKLTPQDPDVSLIRGLLGDNGELRPEIRQQARLARPAYMALFKLDSDLGNHDTAFRYLGAAKEIRKEEYPHDADAEDAKVAALREVFDAGFLRARAGLGCPAEDPIFVVGMPRSGTTLLERVLSGSAGIVAAGELPIVSRLSQEACARFGSNQNDLQAMTRVTDAAWRELGETYLSRARQWVASGDHFVDKMPSNYFYLGFIRTMLPRARIISMSRHPVATCLSIYEQDFATAHAYSNDLVSIGRTYLNYHYLMEYWRGLFGESIIDVEYESLVTDTRGTLTQLARQLDLDLESDLSAIGESQRDGEIRTASRWQARQAIHGESVQRWQKLRGQLQPLLQVLEPILDPQDMA